MTIPAETLALVKQAAHDTAKARIQIAGGILGQMGSHLHFAELGAEAAAQALHSVYAAEADALREDVERLTVEAADMRKIATENARKLLKAEAENATLRERLSESNRWPDPLESPQAEAIRAGKIDDVEIRNLFDQMERELRLHRSSAAEATTEIERLTDTKEGLRVLAIEARSQLAEREAEIERLRAALEDLISDAKRQMANPSPHMPFSLPKAEAALSQPSRVGDTTCGRP